MKLDKDVVKGMLSICLQKQGYTLNDLEEYIKQASEEIKKPKKPESPSPSSTAAKIVGGGIKILGGITGLLGATTGIGAYSAYNQFEDSDKRIAKSRTTIDKIENATKELRSLKAQKQMGYSGL